MDGSYQKINEANPSYGGMDQNSAPPMQGAYPGGQPPVQGGYQGGPPPMQGGYPGGPPPAQGGYPGGPPPAQGGYPGGPPPAQGGYPGGQPPAQGGYPGGQPPAQGGPPPMQGGYPGGQPPAQGGYPGGPPPAQGGYQGGPPPAQGGYQGGPPPGQGPYPPPAGGPPGGYPGGAPPQGQYPPQAGYQQEGGYPAQGGYPPQGGYPGGPQQGYPGGPPPQGQYPPQQGYQSTPQPTHGGNQYGGHTATQVMNTNAPLSAASGPPVPGKPTSFPQGFKPPEIDGDTPEDEMPLPDRPLPEMNPVAGYEGAGFTAGDFFPPPTQFQYPVPAEPPQPREDIPEVATWKGDDVRNALVDYVSEKRCYGKGTANDMEIKEILSSSAFHYTLETFTESRQVNWEHEPYNVGMSVDSAEMGMPPAPWEIPVTAPEYFEEESVKAEVPHTAYVKACHTCLGQGIQPCRHCWGRGRRRCTWCHGDGVRQESTDPEHCTWCSGSGYRVCEHCDSRGVTICGDCNGEGNLKFYLELKVKWKNHSEDYIKEDTPLPDELVKDVSGVIAFQENNMMVWPLAHFPQADINQASNNLIQKHATSFPTEKILQQRHTLRIVPVAEVKYEWKDDTANFFVYGEEKKIYAPNYPQTCCWGCTIL